MKGLKGDDVRSRIGDSGSELAVGTGAQLSRMSDSRARQGFCHHGEGLEGLLADLQFNKPLAEVFRVAIHNSMFPLDPGAHPAQVL